LLATGAEPVRLTIPGADLPHVCYLRTLNDSRRIIEKAKNAKSAVVIGSSFIGLEVAWSLRERKLEVAVVGRDLVPLGKVLGSEMGNLVRETHETHGVKFHLGRTPAAIHDRDVQLDNGTTLDCDFVVIGIGVGPNTRLAEQTGISTDNGVLVNEFLETNVAGIFAAGDIVRWPDPRAGRIRVEHWVVAQRQGQTAARNILGAREPFGDLKAKHASVMFSSDDKLSAIASIGRDLENLKAEAALEHGQEFSPS
jgi:NADPH-dependent 2,4-dienoyl-CoA reductase/sulfur reductase-like enzyme